MGLEAKQNPSWCLRAGTRSKRRLAVLGYIERRKQARAYETPEGMVLSQFVFHRDGRPVAEMRKAWASACRKAGCPERLFHDLRRTCARNLIRSGVARNVAMRITGHKTEAMFERYNITDEADEREAMTKLTQYHQVEQRKVMAMRG